MKMIWLFIASVKFLGILGHGLKYIWHTNIKYNTNNHTHDYIITFVLLKKK